jgi:hypothetical protein
MARTRARNPAQQLTVLERLPLTSASGLGAGKLRWEGRLRPTTHSDLYTVRVDHNVGSKPVVTVLEPELEVPPSKAGLPHVFPGDRLCLCYPWQWKSSMIIAKTIVPWASEWLLHYELWKATGEWHGGGHEPE